MSGCIFKRHRKLAALAFIPLILLPFSLVSCEKNRPSISTTDEAFVENGEAWAWGTTEISIPKAPAAVVLARTAGVNNVNTYSLSAFLQPTVTEKEVRELDYVDYFLSEKSKRKLLAYVTRWKFSPRTGEKNTVDIYVVLKRKGYTFPGRKEIFIGAATFLDKSAKEARVQLRNDNVLIYLSEITGGARMGHLALHFPQAWKDGAGTTGSGCEGISQLPGRLPDQIPAKEPENCRPVPIQMDLCAKVTDLALCKIKTSLKSSVENAVKNFDGTTENLIAMTNETASFTLKEGTTGKIVFTSKSLTATADENAKLCTKLFSAHARALDNRHNSACQLKQAASSVKDGDKLTCAITINFKNAQSALQKDCYVWGAFWREPVETQLLRVVLKTN